MAFGQVGHLLLLTTNGQPGRAAALAQNTELRWHGSKRVSPDKCAIATGPQQQQQSEPTATTMAQIASAMNFVLVTNNSLANTNQGQPLDMNSMNHKRASGWQIKGSGMHSPTNT